MIPAHRTMHWKARAPRPGSAGLAWLVRVVNRDERRHGCTAAPRASFTVTRGSSRAYETELPLAARGCSAWLGRARPNQSGRHALFVATSRHNRSLLSSSDYCYGRHITLHSLSDDFAFATAHSCPSRATLLPSSLCWDGVERANFPVVAACRTMSPIIMPLSRQSIPCSQHAGHLSATSPSTTPASSLRDSTVNVRSTRLAPAEAESWACGICTGAGKLARENIAS